jgi:hypothetical protein
LSIAEQVRQIQADEVSDRLHHLERQVGGNGARLDNLVYAVGQIWDRLGRVDRRSQRSPLTKMTRRTRR